MKILLVAFPFKKCIHHTGYRYSACGAINNDMNTERQDLLEGPEEA
jgi:hypothetical protein